MVVNAAGAVLSEIRGSTFAGIIAGRAIWNDGKVGFLLVCAGPGRPRVGFHLSGSMISSP